MKGSIVLEGVGGWLIFDEDLGIQAHNTALKYWEITGDWPQEEMERDVMYYTVKDGSLATIPSLISWYYLGGYGVLHT